MTIWDGCYNQSWSFGNWSPQAYGQYSFQFIDYNSDWDGDWDEDGDGDEKGDDDDENSDFISPAPAFITMSTTKIKITICVSDATLCASSMDENRISTHSDSNHYDRENCSETDEFGSVTNNKPHDGDNRRDD